MISSRTYDGLLCPLALTLALLATGCPGDDGSAMDTGTDETTDTNPTTTNPTTTNPTTTNPTTTDPDSTGTTTIDPDSTTTDDTTTDAPPEGTCLGLDVVGSIDTVFSMGGGPPINTCDATPAPCGGDVVGTWDVEISCGYEAVPNPLEDACPGSTFTLNVLGQNGSVTFEMDGTYSQDFDVEVEAVLDLDPMMCFGVDCATFEGLVQMDAPDATCADDMGTCSCTFPPSPPAGPLMGTYEVMGDMLVIDVGGEITELDYCAVDGRLDTWSPVIDVSETEALCDVEQDCVDALGDMHAGYICDLPQ